jgi:hypothetical protein
VALCLVGALTFGAIVSALAGVLLAGHGLTIHQLEPLYHSLATLREKLETLDDGWAGLTIGVLSVGLWLAVERDAHKLLRAALDKAAAEAEADAQTGTTIEPTPEMASVSARLDQLRGELGRRSRRASRTRPTERPTLRLSPRWP